MSSLLIGAVLDSAFFSLNRELRADTVETARKVLGCVINTYNPWLCYAPVVADIPSELIFLNRPNRGELERSVPLLGVMADFMNNQGSAALEELPGEKEVWLPSGEGISDNYDAALQILTSSPFLAHLFDEIVDCIIPLGGGRNRGYSTHFARGAIFRSLPKENDAGDVAIDVAHEIGHQVLMVWQSVDPILVSDPAAPVFSQIRRANRPAIQSFHATVALAYMRHLQLALPEDPLVQAAAARRGATYSQTLKHSLSLAIEAMRSNCEMTEVGKAMLHEMEALA